MSEPVYSPEALEIPANPVLHAFQEQKRAVLRSGIEILDLSMINPDIPPARLLIDKLVEASVRPGLHRYAVARGVGRLRTAFAQKYRDAFDVSVDPETQVCVTFGSKDAILHAFMCFPEVVREKKVLVGAPVYPAHAAALELLGYTLASFQVDADESTMLSYIEEQLRHGDIGSVLLNFPHNPTGLVVTGSFWDSVIQLARRYQVFVVNDFVYGELVYEQQAAASLLAADPDCMCSAEVYSLSKGYSIPGWRVGALVGNPSLVRSLSQLKSQVDYGIFLPIQHAAAEALTHGTELAASNAERYSRRAATLSEGLTNLGWQLRAPDAGCCVWATLPITMTCSAQELAGRLLVENGIAVLPGGAFGAECERAIRFALVHDEERLRKVIEVLDGLTNEK